MTKLTFCLAQPRQKQSSAASPMSVVRLWVGGVRGDVSGREVRELFAKCGTVEEVEMGFSGFLFVAMADKECV